jgi:hypothetical protein
MYHGEVEVGIKTGEAKRNEEILEELHATPLEGKLCTYRHKWFEHVHRMEDNRLPKLLIIIQKEDDDHLID